MDDNSVHELIEMICDINEYDDENEKRIHTTEPYHIDDDEKYQEEDEESIVSKSKDTNSGYNPENRVRRIKEEFDEGLDLVKLPENE